MPKWKGRGSEGAHATRRNASAVLILVFLSSAPTMRKDKRALFGGSGWSRLRNVSVRIRTFTGSGLKMTPMVPFMEACMQATAG